MTGEARGGAAAMDEKAWLRLRNAELLAKNEALSLELKALREANQALNVRNRELTEQNIGVGGATAVGHRHKRFCGSDFDFAHRPKFDFAHRGRSWASSSPSLDPNLPRSAAEALFSYCCMSGAVPYSNLLWCSRVSKPWRAKIISSMRLITTLSFRVSWNCRFFGTQVLISLIQCVMPQWCLPLYSNALSCELPGGVHPCATMH